MIQVILVDDHGVVRAGLRKVLEEARDIRVIAEASTGEEAVTLSRKLKPDVVVMDLSMPGMGGIEATKRLAAMKGGPAVLVLTVHQEKLYGMRLLRAGAKGFLEKKVAPEELIDAVYTVARGEYYVSKGLAMEILRREFETASPSQVDLLTDRELEILCLMALGRTVSEVADELKISPKTVGTYRARIKRKLGLRTSADYLRFCLEHGLLESPPFKTTSI